jgi:uncharacterized membrane protein
MNPTVLFAICMASMAGVTLALPWLSPARFLFGVRVGEAFHKSEPGRQALRMYYVCDIAGIAAAIALAFALGLNRGSTWLLAILLVDAGAAVGYYRANRRLRGYASPADAPPAVREADLFAAEDRLPRWMLLWAIPPFLLPLAGAADIHAHWSEIPARFATHYGMDGRPDGWTTRTPLHLYGMFLFAAGLLLWLLLSGIVGYFGARRSPGRRTMLGIMISMMYLMGTVFTGVGILPVRHFPPWMLIAITPAYVAGLLFWIYRKGSSPAPPSESTPDECWTLGDIYNNPNDPALFVPKRMGHGYTINFGNPRGKWVIAGLVGGIGLLIAFMFWMMR